MLKVPVQELLESDFAATVDVNLPPEPAQFCVGDVRRILNLHQDDQDAFELALVNTIASVLVVPVEHGLDALDVRDVEPVVLGDLAQPPLAGVGDATSSVKVVCVAHSRNSSKAMQPWLSMSAATQWCFMTCFGSGAPGASPHMIRTDSLNSEHESSPSPSRSMAEKSKKCRRTSEHGMWCVFAMVIRYWKSASLIPSSGPSLKTGLPNTCETERALCPPCLCIMVAVVPLFRFFDVGSAAAFSAFRAVPAAATCSSARIWSASVATTACLRWGRKFVAGSWAAGGGRLALWATEAAAPARWSAAAAAALAAAACSRGHRWQPANWAAPAGPRPAGPQAAAMAPRVGALR
eukprot:CAMPEP_0179219838 /NCGR_PEP_ID=MMETSP0797-20121207/5261_2 /TAXON_ID=47934 /ORGANISM="Dinophysis acuminata, Strain DAEP01" /LENGTH=349 /DNA_ID=CAMNT_0020926361 /DNA_START=103 /DNA_END=1151 /DNA_ORIENTATION=-